MHALPPLNPALIYKLVSVAEWQQAQESGQFHGSADDQRDGYIHLSNADQVAGTLFKYFSHCDELLLLAIDPKSLGADLRYEVSRTGALFPHLYAALPVNKARQLAFRKHALSEWRLTDA